jgi:PDZ domain-containing secreted protein
MQRGQQDHWIVKWVCAGALAVALTGLGGVTTFAQSADTSPAAEASPEAQAEADAMAETEEQATTDKAAEAAEAAASDEDGLLILKVDPDGPAAAAGLARGDIILAVDDLPLNVAAPTLYERVLTASPGDQLRLTYRHGDDERTAQITLGEQDGRAYLGVQIYNEVDYAVPMAQATALPLPVQETITATWMPMSMAGVVVGEVVAGGPAESAGLAAGDLIIALDEVPIANAKELLAALAELAPGDEVTLTVQRGGPAGEEELVTLTLGVAPDDAERAFLGIRILPSVETATFEAAPALPAMPYAMPFTLPYPMPQAMPYAMPRMMPYPPLALPYAIPLPYPPAPPVWIYGAPSGWAGGDVFFFHHAVPGLATPGGTSGFQVFPLPEQGMDAFEFHLIPSQPPGEDVYYYYNPGMAPPLPASRAGEMF